MKKITLLICLFLLSFTSILAQTDVYTVLPNNGGTSQNGRSPQGGRPANRSVWIITAAEMAASGFTTGSVVTSIGFNLSIAQPTATTGTFVVYLQNTTDATNIKSTTWATAITGMTTVSNSPITIPATVGTYDVPFTGGTAFTYTGDALYVAFDYQNFGTVSATLNTTLCNNSLAGGLKGNLAALGATVPVATVAASDFRPETRLGKQVLCSRPTNIAEVVGLKTLNSVTGTWSNANQTSIEYGPFGFTPGTGTVIANITSPYTLGGLMPSTVYDVYLYNNCGTVPAPINSALTAVESFHTVFEATTPPYTTSFEQQETFSYIGWAETSTTATNAWFINYGGPGSVLVQDGASSAVAISPTAVAANERLYSRGINLAADALVTVTYYVRNYVAAPSVNTASYQLTVGQGQTAAAQTTVLATETGLTNTAFVLKTFTFTPTTAGVYNFGFLHNSPANATGTHAIIVDSFNVTQALGTSEFLASQFAVYPNPAKNSLTISNTANASIDKVNITDVNGRIVKDIEVANVTETQINVSDLTTGIYFVKMTTDQGVVTKKVIKE